MGGAGRGEDCHSSSGQHPTNSWWGKETEKGPHAGRGFKALKGSKEQRRGHNNNIKKLKMLIHNNPIAFCGKTVSNVRKPKLSTKYATF